jgi:ABC-2 type transport system ATP-binding protein
MQHEVLAELNGVHKRFGQITALDGFNLKVRKGELLALLGPNGAGKSTAISLLLGLQQQLQGEVKLFGKSPEDLSARRRIGVMMQEITLPVMLKVRELIELVSSYYPNSLDLDQVVSVTGIESIANRHYGKLSGGQKRQAQFAMAICGQPELLFLDEPTVGLDIEARAAMWRTARDLIKRGSSIVLTTHYLEEAEALADRVAVVTKGRLLAEGSVKEILALVDRKRITCITKLAPEEIAKWQGVQSVSVEAGHLQIIATASDAVLRRLIQSDEHLQDVEVKRAGLAEAFTQLTQEAA